MSLQRRLNNYVVKADQRIPLKKSVFCLKTSYFMNK